MSVIEQIVRIETAGDETRAAKKAEAIKTSAVKSQEQLSSVKLPKKTSLKNLRAVYPTFISKSNHPLRERDILSNCFSISQSTIGNCVNLDQGQNIAFFMFDFGLWSCIGDRISMIFCNDKPAGCRISNLINGILQITTGSNTTGKIRNTGEYFIAVLSKNCRVDISHKNLLYGSRKGLKAQTCD